MQTEEQYIFIYEALNEAIQSGPTELPARNLLTHLQRLLQPINDSSLTEMELEFKVKRRENPFVDRQILSSAIGQRQSTTVEIPQCE